MVLSKRLADKQFTFTCEVSGAERKTLRIGHEDSMMTMRALNTDLKKYLPGNIILVFIWVATQANVFEPNVCKASGVVGRRG